MSATSAVALEPPAAAQRAGAAPRAARTVSPAWLVLLAAPLAMSANAPALILPDLAASFAVTTSTASWLVTAFGWAVALGTPLMAGLIRRKGLRTALRAGAVVTAAGTAVVAVAPWFGLLVAGRAAQAFGGAALVAVAMNLAAGSARRMAAVTASFGVLGAAGPLLGAALNGAASFHLAFAVQAVTLLAVPAVARRTTAAPPVAADRFDALGAGLLAALVTVLVAVPHYPLAGAAAAVPAAGLLLWRVRTRRDGFVPAALIGSRVFLGLSAMTMVLSTSYFALLYAVPVLAAARTGLGTAGVGAAQMAALVAGSALSFVLAAATARTGRVRIAVLLAAVGAAGPLLAVAVPWPPAVFLAMTAAVLASATGQAALSVRAVAAAADRHRPVAIGLFNLLFQLGSAFGPTIAVLLVA